MCFKSFYFLNCPLFLAGNYKSQNGHSLKLHDRLIRHFSLINNQLHRLLLQEGRKRDFAHERVSIVVLLSHLLFRVLGNVLTEVQQKQGSNKALNSLFPSLFIPLASAKGIGRLWSCMPGSSWGSIFSLATY